ncbi:metallophosphoesterase [Neobacillus sedimentimangrovi]|uniref:Phosphoesterase n=1 Tax=Neobacillus sedimentimangrovi TaxID=2699460 RepID=A0ABS8QMJ5_9BACI|nr:metallophosphoesterase [Neobacillus sedimentimangrovi]MCD4840327.1 metallophosphoesterase [Neobacillus sedimentimangrovi]
MSKVLVVSDSHGLTKELETIRERHLSDVDLMIHCGDSQLDPDHPALTGYFTVGGNCDFGGFPQELVSDFAGKKFFITHGHRYSVKTSLMNLKYKAEEVGAEIVCFGHSHVLGAEVVGGTLFLNPGSIRLPRERFEKTYVILDLNGDKVEMSVFDIDGRKIPKLSHQFVLGKDA